MEEKEYVTPYGRIALGLALVDFLAAQAGGWGIVVVALLTPFVAIFAVCWLSSRVWFREPAKLKPYGDWPRKD